MRNGGAARKKRMGRDTPRQRQVKRVNLSRLAKTSKKPRTVPEDELVRKYAGLRISEEKTDASPVPSPDASSAPTSVSSPLSLGSIASLHL